MATSSPPTASSSSTPSNENNNNHHWKPATWAVTAGRGITAAGDPLNVPIPTASNYHMAARDNGAAEADTIFEYARNDGTPAWNALEEVVAGLERGNSDAPVYCTSFSSGMAAIAAVFSVLPIGGTLVVPTDCYGGSVALAEMGVQQGKWKVERLEALETESWIRRIEQEMETAVATDSKNTPTQPTLLLWIESVSNPLLQVADIAGIGAAVRQTNSRVILAVDATFATPLNQRPLTLGADFSVHSATKLMGGHSDLLLGVVSTSGSSDFHQHVRMQRTLHGATPGALETFLCLRGLRTLPLRLRAAQANAMVLAQRLQKHPRVTCVRYPGLHQSSRMRGTVITFDVQGGAAAADSVCATTRIVQHATSLGGVESTMERRQRVQPHMPPSLLRFSVGIEDGEDLWRDLERALELSSSSSVVI